MTNTSNKHNSSFNYTSRLRRARHRFSLLAGKAEDDEIERRICDGIELSGATLWILIFAIFIASVGLNINSTAVVIGAMLISPLMGPIMGVGLGVAVYDFKLVKRALFNLGIATLTRPLTLEIQSKLDLAFQQRSRARDRKHDPPSNTRDSVQT